MFLNKHYMVRIEVTNGQAPFVHHYKEDYTVAYRYQLGLIHLCNWLLMSIPDELTTHYPTTPMTKGLTTTQSKRSITLFTNTDQLKVEVSTYGSFCFLATYIALSVLSINTDNSRSSCG